MSVPVSFISDFGLEDEFVGVVHGVLAKVAPDSKVIDVGHRFARGNVRGAALALMRAIQYLPEGVCLAVVDPGVGTSRKAVAIETSWGYFVAPDNGLVSPAVRLVGGATRAVSLENPEAALPSPGQTFHGRDIFAPAAGLLASGEASLEELGPEVSVEELRPMLLPLSETANGTVSGEVWWIDGFGNAQTNIAPEELAALGVVIGDTLTVKIGPALHALRWGVSYGEVEESEALVHVDSSGLLAIAVNGGSASEELGLYEGISVSLAANRSATAE